MEWAELVPFSFCTYSHCNCSLRKWFVLCCFPFTSRPNQTTEYRKDQSSTLAYSNSQNIWGIKIFIPHSRKKDYKGNRKWCRIWICSWDNDCIRNGKQYKPPDPFLLLSISHKMQPLLVSFTLFPFHILLVYFSWTESMIEETI